MIVAVVGSRDYPDLDAVARLVEGLPRDTILVSGGAKGVDNIAEKTARACGMEVRILLADWDTHGRAAGPIRNTEIIKAADHVFAFHWNGSRGTQDSINKAKLLGKKLLVYRACPSCLKTLPNHRPTCKDAAPLTHPF